MFEELYKPEKTWCGKGQNVKNRDRAVQMFDKAQDLVDYLEKLETAWTKQGQNEQSIIKAEEGAENAKQMLQEAAAAPYTSCCRQYLLSSCWSRRWSPTELFKELDAQFKTTTIPELPEKPQEDAILTTVFSHALKQENWIQAEKKRKGIKAENWPNERLREAEARLKSLSTKASDMHDDDGMTLTFTLPAEEEAELKQHLKKPDEEGFKEVKPFSA